MATSKIRTPYKDCVSTPPSFQVKPTLGERPGQPTDGSAAAGVSGKVSPKPLPMNTNDLWHGPKKA